MPRVSLEFYFNLLRERKRGRQYDRRFQILSILHMCFLWLMFSVSMSNIDKYMVISQNVLPFIEPNNQNKRKNLLKITKYNCNCFSSVFCNTKEIYIDHTMITRQNTDLQWVSFFVLANLLLFYVYFHFLGKCIISFV